MSDAATRARVKRLVAGDVRLDDLTNIFLFLRFRSFRRETVKDIGDFCAHADRRNRGVITESARQFFASIQFVMPRTGIWGAPLKYSVYDAPLFFPEALRGNLLRVDDKELDALGISRDRAHKILESFLKRMAPTPEGRIGLKPGDGVRERETKLVNLLSSLVISRATFSDDMLIADLEYALLKNGLLEDGERQALQGVKDYVTLFAVSKMHLVVVDLMGGALGSLYLFTDTDLIYIFGSVPGVALGTPNSVSGAFFKTSLKAEVNLSPDLLAVPQPWSFPIELTADGKLAKLAF